MADPAQPASRRTALVVDDDERVRTTLTRILRWLGAWDEIGAAADSAEALERAAALRPRLVLIDLWLPDGRGLDLIPALRAATPPPRIVVLTAEEDPELREQALASGADSYLLKTTPADALIAALRALAAAL
ncbi:MAG TPA: response regulator [Roseiflexaceae bacterium]|nr:response regulator [Roseiflexaceae bacterium]